jgi:hypothetical protein
MRSGLVLERVKEEGEDEQLRFRRAVRKGDRRKLRLTHVMVQIELVEEQTGDMDPKTNFRLIIIQTELERFKFLVRSYLRARLAKVGSHDLITIATTKRASFCATSCETLIEPPRLTNMLSTT